MRKYSPSFDGVQGPGADADAGADNAVRMAATPIIVQNGFLTRAECSEIVARAEAQEWHQARINVGDGEEELDLEERRHMRTYLDDAALADVVSKRLQPRVPHAFVNPRFRVLKYAPGDYFRPHYDGEQTHMGGVSTHTVLVYLCDMPHTGATHFCDLAFRVFPAMGCAVVFKQDDHLHEGEPPTTGTKLVMRTDLMQLFQRS